MRASCVGAFLLCGAAGTASAQTAFLPYGALQYQHDSNLFYLPADAAMPLGKSGPTFADITLSSRVGIDATYDWGRQVLRLVAEGRGYDYKNYPYLNHREALIDAAMDWKVGSLFDGTVGFRHDRRMVPFQSLIASRQLFIENQNIATASANLKITPNWRLESTLKDRALDSPRPFALNLRLHEDSIHEALLYLGFGELATGIEMEYLSGRFSNSPVFGSLHYQQISTEGVAKYAASGLTTFKGTLGYTRRRDSAGSDLSGITGSLALQRNLSGKTSVTAKLTRAVNSYLSTTGSEIDTTAALALNYQVTYKTQFNAGYYWAENKFPNSVVLNGVVFDNRTDRLQYANIEASYQALHWLSIRAYARRETRHSNFAISSYDTNIYGIELQAKLPRRN